MPAWRGAGFAGRPARNLASEAVRKPSAGRVCTQKSIQMLQLGTICDRAACWLAGLAFDQTTTAHPPAPRRDPCRGRGDRVPPRARRHAAPDRHAGGPPRRRPARRGPHRAAVLQLVHAPRRIHVHRHGPHAGPPVPGESRDAGGRAVARRKLDAIRRWPALHDQAAAERRLRRRPSVHARTTSCFPSRRPTTSARGACWPTR